MCLHAYNILFIWLWVNYTLVCFQESLQRSIEIIINQFTILTACLVPPLSGFNMVKAYSTVNMQFQQNYYRTNSHAGFPKGSYAVPNPVHFHVAKYTYTANRMQPALIKIPPQIKRRIYNSRNFNYKIEKPTVTIKIGNTQEVSLNISMQTLQEFVFPLASALNFINIPLRANKSSQTSYVHSCVAPLVKNNKSYVSDFSSDEELSDFEYNILQNLRHNLIQDLSQNVVPKTELSSTINYDTVEQESESTSTEDIDEVHSVEPQLRLLADQVSDSLISITRNVCDFEEVVHDALNILKELPFASVTDDVCLSNSVKNENRGAANAENPDLIINMTHGKYLEDGKPDDTSHVPEDSYEDTENYDEGYNDSINNNTNQNDNCDHCDAPDEVVSIMSQVIFDYLIQQGFEIKELVLFPEVLYDQNIYKLFSDLKQLYDEHCGSQYSNERKNELRINIGFEVLKQLQLHDSMNESNSDDSLISDKLFSISEFLSDILDHFFGSLAEPVNDSFTSFKDSLISGNNELSSTPGNTTAVKDNNYTSKGDEYNLHQLLFDQVTSFKKNISEKSGSETYWISINKKNNLFDLPKSPSVQKKVVNVDDIPLKPPATLHLSSCSFSSTKLSPILEETKPCRSKDCNIEYSDEVLGESASVQSDVLAGGDNEESVSYIAFERPEVNVVVCDEVNFYRTNTINTMSYIQSKTVNFQVQNSSSTYQTELVESEQDRLRDVNHSPKNVLQPSETENSIESEESDGNWMGYEQARF